MRAFILATLTVAACSGSGGNVAPDGHAADGQAADRNAVEVTPGAEVGPATDASAETGSDGGAADAAALDFVPDLGGADRADGGAIEDGGADAPAETPLADAATTETGADAAADALTSATLATNRDRLLGTYLAFLRTQPVAQSNGLKGSALASVCELWSGLDPSSQAVFLLETARLEGSRVGGGPAALDHVVKLYRVVGGMGATADDPGTCGGAESNRMIMSMDTTLHAAFIAANEHMGATQGSGRPDITDIPNGGYWRNSQDPAGPDAPFDLSDETSVAAPRGQVHLFADPGSALAAMPLGRADLSALVDPQALEMDQYFDCPHNANPLCTYITYGPLCFPEVSASGVSLYVAGYGDFDATWKPAGCP